MDNPSAKLTQKYQLNNDKTENYSAFFSEISVQNFFQWEIAKTPSATTCPVPIPAMIVPKINRTILTK